MKMFIATGLLIFALSPLTASAIDLNVGLPFGGFVTSFVPCLCPPFGMLIQYKPLFLASSIPLVGQLYYRTGTRLYTWFVPFGPIIPGTPATWNLGGFIPDGGECSQPDPAAAVDADPCAPGIPVPALGTIKYMGSSLPTGNLSL